MSERKTPLGIYWLQIASISTMWVFVLGISYWIVHLLLLSQRLNDVPGASVAISIVAIPVFLTGAGVLTYVFFGLRRWAPPAAGEGGEGGERISGRTGARISIVALGLLLAASASAGDLAVPDNPLRGRQLFESKGCHQCHGLAGGGPGIGPDLGAGHYGGSFLDLGAALWNHVPGMSASFEQTETGWPELSEQEATDLLAFLYFIDYLGRPGVARAGKRLFLERRCSECHVVGEVGRGELGPDLSKLEQFASPLFIAQAIWNHGPSMFQTMREARMSPPNFQSGDLADLSAFIRQQSRVGAVQRVLVAPGNPNRGRELFAAKGCAICHGALARGGDGGPDLESSDVLRSAESIAASMWNHASAMDAKRKQLGLSWPSLTTEELADLVAFLYFLPFNDATGDHRRGAAVFKARSCHECHGAASGSAPELADLLTTAETQSAAAFVAAMWSHAPVMRETILAEGRAWPELSGQELRDLLAFLESEAAAGATGR